MEGVLLHASSAHENHISPYIRNPNILNRGLIHRNFSPVNPYTAAGVLQAPPPPFLYHSYPSFSLQPPPVPSQPPLLPLPITAPRRTTSTTTLARHLSCPPINNRRGKNLNNPKKSSKDSKESKPNYSTSPKKGEKNLRRTTSTVSSSPPSVNNINRIGGNGVKNLDVKDLEIERQINGFSGSSVFTISPPPSSLPLPTFSLRPKLSCNAQATAGVDSGATDNLRRLLRLP